MIKRKLKQIHSIHQVKILSLVGLLTLSIGLVACKKLEGTKVIPTPTTNEQAAPLPISKSSFKLNTIISITLYDSTDESIIEDSFALCDYYEKLLSRTIEESEIYQLNHQGTLELSENTLEVLTAGLSYSELSNGGFDITLEPLTSLWNFGTNEQRLPAKEEIDNAVSHIGYQNLLLNGNTATFQKEGMGIDLGAIAKGFIADKIKELLLSRGVNSALINLGGNILCVGEKPGEIPFNVGIQKPFENRNETIAIMQINDLSVVSSGIYERFFTEGGRNYHHLLNPFTGYPYENDLISVTIISKKSVDGDALSTTCFALGLEKGMQLIESLDDTYAVFITSDYELHYTDGFTENITLVSQ